MVAEVREERGGERATEDIFVRYSRTRVTLKGERSNKKGPSIRKELSKLYPIGKIYRTKVILYL